MKVKLVAFLMLACMCCRAQTTWDEYNYCSKGFREVMEKGLSNKEGYTVTAGSIAKAKYGEFEIRRLTEQSTGKVKALIVIYWKADLIHHYFCIADATSAEAVTERCYDDWNVYFNKPGSVNADGDVILFALASALVKTLK